MPKLSVVVPFYNVERYVEDCLASIAGQTLRDLEVVLVDDGSLDGTREVAERFVATDSRFRIVTKLNGGLGPARNTGVPHTSGTYLTFVDSDDVVPREAFALMVGRLDRSGSDFAAGNARRFNVHGVRKSWLHGRLFTEDLSRADVNAHPWLANDRMVWNKVYRRSFWDAGGSSGGSGGGYEFPAVMYEDYPVTFRAYLDAGAVEVVRTPIYAWRERDAGETSITQRAHEPRNVRDRVESARQVLAQAGHAASAVRRVVHDHLAATDVGAVAHAVVGGHTDPDTDSEARASLLASAQQLVSMLDPEVIADRGPLDRVQADLIARGDVAGLTTLIDLRDLRTPAAGHERVGWRRERLVTVPGADLGAASRAVRHLRPRELDLAGLVRSSTPVAGRPGVQALEVECYVRFSGPVEVPRLTARLRRRGGEESLPLVVRDVRTVPEPAGPSHRVRGVVEVDGDAVLAASGDAPLAWVVLVRCETDHAVAEGPLEAVLAGSATYCTPYRASPWHWIQTGRHEMEHVVRVIDWPVRIDAVVPDARGELRIAGASRHVLPQGRAELQLTAKGTTRLYPALVDVIDRHRWTAHVQLADLTDPTEVDPLIDDADEWAVRMVTPRREDKVALDPELPVTRVVHRGREVQVLSNRFHVAELAVGNPSFTVEKVVAHDSTVRLAGAYFGEWHGDEVARLRWYAGLEPEQVTLPLVREPDGPDFALSVDVDELARRVVEAILADPTLPVARTLEAEWDLSLRHGDRTTTLHLTTTEERRLPGPWTVVVDGRSALVRLGTHRQRALRFVVEVAPNWA